MSDITAGTHVAILTLSATLNGQVRQYATAERAQQAIDRFGHAVTVERVDTDTSTHLHVTCRTQRGPGGAFTMHEIACAYGVPVHVA